jgi:hypothetical protein
LAAALAQQLSSDDPESRVAASIIKVAISLLRSDEFPISTSFIKGTVDADRIDFTRRDGHFSGLFSSAIDYGRLFTLYTLEEVKVEGAEKSKEKAKENSRVEEKEPLKIMARPSVRAISETEKLLLERFQDYKYIVMHHKVHLYDEVVENILVRLLSEGTLNQFLEDLIYLLKLKPDQWHKRLSEKSQDLQLLQAVLLEFDDPWLESHIRSTYRKNLNKSLKLQGESATLFEVYVEERKRFTSAFKSDCEFWDAVEKYAPRLHKLRPLSAPIGEEIINVRSYFFGALYAMKFSLQAHLRDQMGCMVLVGPADRKVNYGVRNDDIARFYQVRELVDFLKLKKFGTMLFNLWFESDSKYTKEKFIQTALPIVENVVLEDVDKNLGIRELQFGKR